MIDFHAKYQVPSSRNGWAIAVGTKEDTLFSIHIYLSYTVQTNFACTEFGQ